MGQLLPTILVAQSGGFPFYVLTHPSFCEDNWRVAVISSDYLLGKVSNQRP